MGVVVAASMTWGEYTVVIPIEEGGGVGEFSSNGWAGRLILGELALPNVLVVFAAVIACWCSWLRALAIGGIPAILPALFLLYALGHASAIAFVYLGPDAQIGPGLPLSVASSAAMLTLLSLEVLGQRRPRNDARDESLSGKVPAEWAKCRSQRAERRSDPDQI